MSTKTGNWCWVDESRRNGEHTLPPSVPLPGGSSTVRVPAREDNRLISNERPEIRGSENATQMLIELEFTLGRDGNHGVVVIVHERADSLLNEQQSRERLRLTEGDCMKEVAGKEVTAAAPALRSNLASLPPSLVVPRVSEWRKNTIHVKP